MKLSKETVAIIKNFAGINSNLLLKEGNKLATISARKDVMAGTTVTETFPSEFGVYDLNEFLGAMSIFEDPELTFSDKYVTISQSGRSIKYFSASADVLLSPQKAITFPASDVNFNLSSEQLDMIRKTASVLRSEDLSLVGDGSKIVAVVGDKKSVTANSFSEQVGTTDKSFKFNLKVDNLKMLPGSYDVSISSKKISRFKGAGDLVYYVAVETDSTFASE